MTLSGHNPGARRAIRPGAGAISDTESRGRDLLIVPRGGDLPMTEDGGLRAARRRLEVAEARAAIARAERDAILVTLASDTRASYAELAAVSGLSVSAVAKIIKAGGVRRYRPRGERGNHDDGSADEVLAGGA